MTPHPDEDRFLRAIAADPADEPTRLVYADWLDDHGDAERAAYLRAEVACFRLPWEERAYDWDEPEGVDPVWRHRVSRTGILVPGLTWAVTGPPITPADLRAVEDYWSWPLPPDYAAFLLAYNGGAVTNRYLFSWREDWNDDGERDDEYFVGHVRLFALGETDPGSGTPYHRTSASILVPGPLTDDDRAFARMIPIGTVSYHDEEGDPDVDLLVLDRDPEYEDQRYRVLICYQDGLSMDEAHECDSFSAFFHGLDSVGPDDSTATGSPHDLPE